MTDQKDDKAQGRMRVTQAVLWAAALIGTALILKGTEQADKVYWLILMLAATSVITTGAGRDCERKAWRKLFGKGTE